MEDKIEYVELEPVERKDRWILWEIEDRVAKRVSPVFCAPSELAVEKQYKELLDKHKLKESEIVCKLIAVYDCGKFLVLEEGV